MDIQLYCIEEVSYNQVFRKEEGHLQLVDIGGMGSEMAVQVEVAAEGLTTK